MSQNSKVLLAAIAGAAVGVIAGILVAPASGKDTFEDLSKKAEELKDDLEDIAAKGRKSVRELSDTVTDNLQKNINGLKKEVSRAKDS
ncbi:YtxH domain-containing protein [Flexithrix dorotheae]|uniref:YtxH domain-containing protein n=1 Tax=Flexithrix dorotheae TaxID=70993 RepID=UPI00037E64E6|nr:YtxH domain-containing protein [Flexithrix dorotheae]